MTSVPPDGLGGRFPRGRLKVFLEEIEIMYGEIDKFAGNIFRSNGDKWAAAVALAASFRDWERAQRYHKRKNREMNDDDDY